MKTDDQERVILLGHGGGGRLTSQLLEDVILPVFRNPVLDRRDDSACVDMPSRELVLTTDSYVVDPLFFPGGDIGRLAVCGTVNDLAMQGGHPLYLTFALVLEEGLPLRDLKTILASAAAAAEEAGVCVVAGDTKVVERGRGIGVMINTSGVGVRRPQQDVSARRAQPGDAVIINGTVGDHGMAVMSRREGLAFETDIRSDVAPLSALTTALFDTSADIHCLRDPTRGGVTAALCDIAAASGHGIQIEEASVPVRPDVQGACNLLGLDVLNVANEGKALIICPEAACETVLDALRTDPLGTAAARIGKVVPEHPGTVTLRTGIGGERILTPPTGEELPRIC